MNIDKIISTIHTLKEGTPPSLKEEGIAPANNVGSGHIAGTKEAGDDPPVDLRKRRSWSIFWKDAARRDRKKKKG